MTTLKKVGAYGPAVVASVVLTFVVGAVLPPPVGLAVFVGGLAVMVALLLGVGESSAVRILFRARGLTLGEADALAPAVALLCQRGVPMDRLDLRVQDGVVPIAACGVGRRTVVVSAGLVGAVRDGQLPVDQAAAVLGHGAGVVLSCAVRSDPALAFWTLPWQVIQRPASAIAVACRRLPLAAVAWKVRFVLAVVAAVQAVAAGQPVVALVLVTATALAYAAGAGDRAWAATIRDIGDDQVARASLANAMARFLLRCSRSPSTHERVHALTGPALRPRPALVTSAP